MIPNPLLLTLLNLLAALATFAQADNSACPSKYDMLTGRQIFIFPDQMPKPEGGELKLLEEILSKLKVQPNCMTVDSRIIVGFIVEPDGLLTGKRIISDIKGLNLAGQVLEIVDLLKWTPGVCQGEPVPVLYQLPVRICWR